MGRLLRRLIPPRPHQPPAAQQRARRARIGGYPRRGRAVGAGQGTDPEPWPSAPQDHAISRPGAPRLAPSYAGQAQACAADATKMGFNAWQGGVLRWMAHLPLVGVQGRLAGSVWPVGSALVMVDDPIPGAWAGGRSRRCRRRCRVGIPPHGRRLGLDSRPHAEIQAAGAALWPPGGPAALLICGSGAKGRSWPGVKVQGTLALFQIEGVLFSAAHPRERRSSK